MSDSDRVQRWRKRQREAGKVPLTIWLTTAEKVRLEALALTQRCSPSELVQRLLAEWHGEPQAVPAPVAETEQIRALVQQELSRTQTITATVADTVTATLHQALPGLVRALLAEQHAGSVSAAVTAPVTDTVTDTVAVHGPVTVPGSKVREPFDTTRYYLGKLCPKGHAFDGTGQSLLRRHNQGCRECENEGKRARRAARLKHAQMATRGRSRQTKTAIGRQATATR